MVTDANQNDADACVGFNIAWTAVERGQQVTMLFDSWAGYNVKRAETFLGLSGDDEKLPDFIEPGPWSRWSPR